MSAWHHLVALGLLRDLLAAVVNIGGASAAAWLPWKRHRRAQRVIADRLDTSTPGGLGDLVTGKAATR